MISQVVSHQETKRVQLLLASGALGRYRVTRQLATEDSHPQHQSFYQTFIN